MSSALTTSTPARCRNRAHSRRQFLFINHDLVEHLEVAEPVDIVFHLASPASPIDYLRLPLHTLKVGSYKPTTPSARKFKPARSCSHPRASYGDPQIHPQPGALGKRGSGSAARRVDEASATPSG